jgi:hypothetical protein
MAEVGPFFAAGSPAAEFTLIIGETWNNIIYFALSLQKWTRDCPAHLIHKAPSKQSSVIKFPGTILFSLSPVKTRLSLIVDSHRHLYICYV